MNTFEQTLLEHGFARVIRILWGDVPNVKRIGIMTANNPQYKQLSQKENESRNRQLMAWLRTSGFGPIKIKGKFTQSDEGKEEDSLLIPHIRRDILLSWARHKDVDQGAVIWGQKKEDEDKIKNADKRNAMQKFFNVRIRQRTQKIQRPQMSAAIATTRCRN